MQSRRSFLQAAAAAFSAVALGRLGTPSAPGPRPIEYSRFLMRPDDWWKGYELSAPFSQGELVCATDSRILLTHPGELSGTGSARVPDISKLNWSEFDSRGWRELPKDARVVPAFDVASQCVHCQTTGFIGDFVECPQCYGSGDVLTERDFFEDCHRCEARGALGTVCQYCKGEGYTHTAETLYGERWSVFYLDALRRLGPIETRLIQGARSADHGETPALIFRGEQGIRGFLMPFVRPGENQ